MAFATKFLKALFYSAVLFTYASCGAGNDDLTVDVGPPTAYVLPIDISSCLDIITATTEPPAKSVTAGSLSLTKFSLKWKGKIPLHIEFMQVIVTSGQISGGKHSCLIAADDLLATLNTNAAGLTIPASDGVTPKEINLATGTGAGGLAGSFPCTIRCGGIQMNDKTKDVFGTGKITVFATTTDNDGNQTPVDTETDFSFQYKGISN